jgi:type IV pilus assembly protein PilQ
VIDLEIQAAEADGRSKTVSNPRVITSNLTPASISQGTSIPYKTTSTDGTKTEFAKANLALNVTPQILNNDEIILDVNVSKDIMMMEANRSILENIFNVCQVSSRSRCPSCVA